MGYDHWMTPPDELELARSVMGSITLDPASSAVAQQYVHAEQYAVLPEEYDGSPGQVVDGLQIAWSGNVWLNPPYSKPVADFAKKAVEELPNVTSMMILVNSQTDAAWYHLLMEKMDYLCLYRGRIKFWKVFDGAAHQRWISTTTSKMTNSPRYTNSVFFHSKDDAVLKRFAQVYARKGKVLVPLY
jgi:hypothetical protein